MARKRARGKRRERGAPGEPTVSVGRPSTTVGQELFRAGRYREAIAAWKGLGGQDLGNLRRAEQVYREVLAT